MSADHAFRTRRDVNVRTLTTTVVSCIISCVACLVAFLVFFGTDMDATVSVGRVLMFGIVASIVVPAIMVPLSFHAMAEAVRARNVAQAKLDRIAQTDQLTGLLNRRGLDAASQDMTAEARARGLAVSALVVDIDHFKQVNDRYGHAFGDAALVVVADILREAAGRSGFAAARHGGDEFIVLAIGLDDDATVALAERIRRTCTNRPVEHGTDTAGMTLSIGMAHHPDATMPFAVLSRRADAALYAAKKDGRNRVGTATLSEMPTAA